MPEVILDVPVRSQEQSLWCWAAVSSGISAAYADSPLAPCAIAAAVLNHPCCKDPVPCNRVCELTPALRVVNLDCTPRDMRPKGNPATFAEVEAWIRSQKRPVGARIQDNQTRNGHFVLVVGCDASSGTVVCADPNGTPGFPAPRYRMRFETLVKNYGGWGWCTDLYFVH